MKENWLKVYRLLRKKPPSKFLVTMVLFLPNIMGDKLLLNFGAKFRR